MLETFVVLAYLVVGAVFVDTLFNEETDHV